MKKIFILILTLICLFCGTIATSQENLVLAAKPEIHFAHNLYFIDMSVTLTLEWTGTAPQYRLRAKHVEGNKYYDVIDLDGDMTDELATVKPPRTGHIFFEVVSADSQGNIIEPWRSGAETAVPEEPIGWFCFVRPAAPIGGGIETLSEEIK